jgi:hypothetical protein
MRRLIICTIALFGIIFCTNNAIHAQLSTNEAPYSWEESRNVAPLELIPTATMPHLDIEALKREDLANRSFGVPYRFGFSHGVNLNLTHSGSWETTADGGRLWRLRIFSPDALSLNLLYDRFWLPDGAKFFIYSEDMRQSIGAFTSKNNKGGRMDNPGFATEFLFTTSIVLEYYEPADVSDPGIISVARVVSGYRSLFKQEPDNPDMRCFVDINCGGYGRDERNAVAYMTMDGYSCSGALLNTTENNYAPLFLSANHCFIDTIPTAQWVFYWHRESSDCESEIFDPGRATSGATLLAKREDTDFMLLELIEDPASRDEIQLHYLGWDRAPRHTASGIGIHHPLRMPKMISYMYIYLNEEPIPWHDDNEVLIGISPPYLHWKAEITRGSTHKGSSGSPLIVFPESRVIGQLHGNVGFCRKDEEVAWYGRFDLSWNGVDSTTRLRDWLDPFDSNILFVDGLAGKNCVTNYFNKTIFANTTVAGCRYLNVQNVDIRIGAIVEMTAHQIISVSPNFHAPADSEVHLKIVEPSEKSPSPHYQGGVLADNNPKTVGIKEVGSEVFQLFPNPATNEVTIKGEGITQVEIYDITGRKLSSHHLIPTSPNQTVNVSNLTSGIYFVKVFSENNTAVTKRLVIAK